MATPSPLPSGEGGSEPGSQIRVLSVLETLAGMEQPAGLEAVAAATNLTVSKVYRSLRALQDQGFVDHVGRQGYRLGSRAVALASLIGPRPALKSAAQPLLNSLAAAVGETVTLHVRSGAFRVLVLGAEPRPGPARPWSPDQRAVGPVAAPLRRTLMIGERAPLISGCSGTAILAFLPPATVEEVLAGQPRGLPRPSAATLSRIRESGYAMSFSDNHVGMNGVAAPVLDPEDDVALASVVVSGAEVNLPEDVLHEISDPLRATGADLAARMASVLGPHSSQRLASHDVTVQSLLEEA